MTLEQLLAKEQSGVLYNIQLEINEAIIPATGYTHEYIRKVNRMIDAGELCINPTTYRKVYLPTFARAVCKELARRWTNNIRYEKNNDMSALDALSLYIQKTMGTSVAKSNDLAYRVTDRLDEFLEELMDDQDYMDEESMEDDYDADGN